METAAGGGGVSREEKKRAYWKREWEREREKDSRERKRMAEREEEVVIVGGGIAGLATALALHRVGIGSLVLERSDELRTTGAAISLFPNAWRALGALGVAHKLTPLYHAVQKTRVTNLVTGATQVVSLQGTNGSDGTELRAVHRKNLLEALSEELPSGTIRFSSKLASIKTEVLQDSSLVNVLHLEDGSVVRAKVLIGCDGVHSVVAQWLGLTAPIDAGRSAVRALAVFPEGHGFKMKEAQQYVGIDKRVGIVRLNDEEIYWFTTNTSTPRDREIAGDPELIQREVIENIASDLPPEFLNVVAHSDLSTLSWAPLMFRRPWDLFLGPTHKGNVAVAGDAMHPMTPDLGQGGGAALEDAVVLARCISTDRATGIERYVKERRWRVAGLIVGAYMSGLVQQGWPGVRGWALRLFRDHIFYRFVFPMIVEASNYDCGSLPAVV